MAIKRKTVGTGITAHETLEYSGDDIKVGADAIFRGWAADYEEGGGNFGAVTLDAIKVCKRIMNEAGEEPHDRDSPPWFAQRILRHYDIVKAQIKSGESDSAARFAFHMGEILTQLKMKVEWERYALPGQKIVEPLDAARNRNNKKRKDESGAEHQRWNVEAKKIWAGKPNLSGAAVAELIKARLGVDREPGTIRDVINKHRRK